MGADMQELLRLRKRRRNLEELYDDALRQEQELADKLNRERGPVDAPLGAKYERTFTSTWIGRKILDGYYEDKVDSSKTGEVQSDNGGEKERKPPNS